MTAALSFLARKSGTGTFGVGMTLIVLMLPTLVWPGAPTYFGFFSSVILPLGTNDLTMYGPLPTKFSGMNHFSGLASTDGPYSGIEPEMAMAPRMLCGEVRVSRIS
jgi:hypothetical protein